MKNVIKIFTLLCFLASPAFSESGVVWGPATGTVVGPLYMTEALNINTVSTIDNIFTGGTASAVEGYSQPPSNAFDSNLVTFFNGTNPSWLKYDLGAGNGKAAVSYALVSSRDEWEWSTLWTFEGSNDDATWDTLDTKTGQGFPGANVWVTFNIANTTSYRYYRLNGLSGPMSVSISEFKASATQILLSISANGSITADSFTGSGASLTGVVKTESDPVYSADEAFNITASSTSNWNTAYGWGDWSGEGFLTAETDPVFVAAQSTIATTDKANTFTKNITIDPGAATLVSVGGTPTSTNYIGAASLLFDNNLDTYCDMDSGESLPNTMTYQLTTARAVNNYLITADTTNSGQPTGWTFQGSLNGSAWDTLSTVSGITWSGKTTKSYIISNSVKYLYYRLNITNTTSGLNNGRIYELRLKADVGITIGNNGTITATTFSGSGASLTGVVTTESDPVFVASVSTIAVTNASNTFTGLQIVNGNFTSTGTITADNGFMMGSVDVSSTSADAVTDTTITVTCTGGKKILNGGCQTAPAVTITQSYKSASNAWTCGTSAASEITATAVCILKD